MIFQVCAFKGLSLDQRTGIINQAVDAACLFRKLPDHHSHLLFVPYIGARQNAVGVLLNLRDCFFASTFCSEVVDPDEAALAAEHYSRCGTDPAAGTGD